MCNDQVNPDTDDEKEEAEMHEIEKENLRALEKNAHVVATQMLAVFAEQEPIVKFFAFEHLPEKLREVSFSFASLALQLMNLPRSAERTVALRKVLEGKDAAVRAAL